MSSKNLSELVWDGRKHGVEVKRVGDMAYDEMHRAVPMGEEKLEYLKTMRRNYSNDPTIKEQCEALMDVVPSQTVLMFGAPSYTHHANPIIQA